MDFNALQHKLFALDPTDPVEDKKKLMAQAQGGSTGDVPPTKDYVVESASVPEGSMPLGIDSIADFAKLAGVVTEAPQGFKAGFKGYASKDPWFGAGENPDSKKDDKPKDKEKEKPVAAPAPQPVSQPMPGPAPAPQPVSNPWPTSAEGHTLAKGDLVTYTNKKGQERVDVPVKDLLYKTKDGKGRPQIQLVLKGATYAISREQITAVNGKKFTLVDPEQGKGTIEALESRVAYLEGVIKTLLEGKTPKMPATPNPVAKHMNTYNKASVVPDKKKDAKAGKTKHKGKQYESIKDELWARLNELGKS
jgi:hypothetical protein